MEEIFKKKKEINKNRFSSTTNIVDRFDYPCFPMHFDDIFYL